GARRPARGARRDARARGGRAAGVADRPGPRARPGHRVLRRGRRLRHRAAAAGGGVTARLLDGTALAHRVREEVARDVARLPEPPGLATVLIGDDPASAVYVRSKRRRCVEAGIRDLHRHLPAHVTQDEAAAVVDELAADPAVSGILLQLPLPPHLDPAALINRIPPGKDVDGLTEASAGRLALRRPGLRPCTPQGVLALLDDAGVALAGAHAVVVGRSDLV